MLVPTNRFDGTLFGPVAISTNTPPGYKFMGWMSQNKTVDSEEIIFSKGSEWTYYDQGSLDDETGFQFHTAPHHGIMGLHL